MTIFNRWADEDREKDPVFDGGEGIRQEIEYGEWESPPENHAVSELVVSFGTGSQFGELYIAVSF